MHELSLATQLLDTIVQVATARGAKRVTEARVRIGAFSCVNAEALALSFEAVARGSVAEGCSLITVAVAGEGACRACGWKGAVTDPYAPICPSCDALALDVKRGRDLQLETITID